MQEQLSQAEKQLNRFVGYIKQVITPERLKKFAALEDPEKLTFYIIYSTSSFESTENFEKLLDLIRIHGNSAIDREVTTLIEYMLNHREQCARYEEVNLATLKVANNLFAESTRK